MLIEKYINEYGKECYKNVKSTTKFSELEFHQVHMKSDDGDTQFALHTNLGSLTVLNRMTGFGRRDIETGFRSMNRKFWLASGNYDVRNSGAETIAEAIAWIKKRSNNCKGCQC